MGNEVEQCIDCTTGKELGVDRLKLSTPSALNYANKSICSVSSTTTARFRFVGREANWRSPDNAGCCGKGSTTGEENDWRNHLLSFIRRIVKLHLQVGVAQNIGERSRRDDNYGCRLIE